MVFIPMKYSLFISSFSLQLYVLILEEITINKIKWTNKMRKN